MLNCFSSFCHSNYLLTLSNAFLKSIKQASVIPLQHAIFNNRRKCEYMVLTTVESKTILFVT